MGYNAKCLERGDKRNQETTLAVTRLAFSWSSLDCGTINDAAMKLYSMT